jgi:cyclic beta-1,2-glucan synthetase
VTAYAEWVLGSGRAPSAPFIVTERDADTGALTARNAWNEQCGSAIAFSDLGGRQTAWTADRTEFFGRNGSPDAPSALAPGVTLSGRTGAGLEPCAALQAKIDQLQPASPPEKK